MQNVVEAAHGVVERGGEGAVDKRKLDGHRVAGEIASHQVALERVAEGDLGVARHAVVQVRTKRGDLDLLAALDARDRAELDAGVPGLLAPDAEDLRDHLRAGRGGEVEVVAQPPEHGIAHRPTDEVERLVALREQRRQRLKEPR